MHDSHSSESKSNNNRPKISEICFHISNIQVCFVVILLYLHQKLKCTYFLSAFFKLIQWISQSIYENQWASVEFIIIICLGSMMYLYVHEHVSITLEVVCPIQLSTVHHDEQRMLQIFRVCASLFPSRSWLSSSSWFWLFITLNIQYCISLMLMLLILLQRHSMKWLYWSQSHHCCDVSLLFLSSISFVYVVRCVHVISDSLSLWS